jgi:hypothetical protein
MLDECPAKSNEKISAKYLSPYIMYTLVEK